MTLWGIFATIVVFGLVLWDQINRLHTSADRRFDTLRRKLDELEKLHIMILDRLEELQRRGEPRVK